MKKYKQISLLFFLFALLACAQTKTAQTSKETQVSEVSKNDTLYRFCEDEMESESPYLLCGYANSQGDTVIEMGKYLNCFDDFLVHYAVVLFKDTLDRKLIAIDRSENILFEVFWSDNGPDWLEDGLFRIIENGKIGYANEKGEIVIKPQFECAEQFSEGRATVTYECELIPQGEHLIMKSDAWFEIDKTGKRVQ